MLSDRLTTAIDAGFVAIPETGLIAVIAPHIDDDLTALPKNRVIVVSGLYPVNHAFSKAGYATAVGLEGPYALAIVVLPRARAQARAAIAEAMSSCQGSVIIDGQKTDGIGSALKDLQKRGLVQETLSKAHGKMFSITQGTLDEWRQSPNRIPRPIPTPNKPAEFITAPGAFSADKIDPGSRVLADGLPDRLKGTVVDLGAGWGYLSDAVLDREDVTSVDLVEADHPALEAARQNITDPRARFHWADARSFRPDALVDHVVTNPPFHTGRSAEPSLGQAFIRAAAAMLKPSGKLWLVANRHLPYEKTLETSFRDVEIIHLSPQYKFYCASRPSSSRKGK